VKVSDAVSDISALQACSVSWPIALHTVAGETSESRPVSDIHRVAASRLLPAKQADARHLGNWLVDFLDRAFQAPEKLHQPLLRESISEDILQRLAATVCASTKSPTRRPSTLRRDGFDRALAYLRQADLSDLAIPEICKAAGVSQRTLEYAYR
jgi:hypothetical protein